MVSNIEELLDILYEMIDEAKNLPLSSDKCILERDKALDILEEIKNKLPVELQKAQELVANKNDYISSAKREADGLRKQAEDYVKRITSEDELAQQVKRQAEEMIAKAEEQGRMLKRAANEYCEDTLRRMEEAVAEAYDEVKRSHAKFRSALGTGTPSGSRPMYDAEADID